MKKVMGFLVLVGMVVVVSGCAYSHGVSAGKGSVGVHTRAHAWEEPHFTADLEANPATSELGMGFVTVGSHVGWGDHPEGKWVSVNIGLGPDAPAEE